MECTFNDSVLNATYPEFLFGAFFTLVIIAIAVLGYHCVKDAINP